MEETTGVGKSALQSTGAKRDWDPEGSLNSETARVGDIGSTMELELEVEFLEAIAAIWVDLEGGISGYVAQIGLERIKFERKDSVN
jgi:hypothetical protein